MYNHKSWLILAAMMPFLAAACGGEADRSALRQDELDRELELALEGDSIPATFEDTAVAEPEPDPASVAPAPPPRRPEPEPQAPPPDPVPETVPPPVDPGPEMATATVAVGTTLTVSLDETLSTETSQPGDAFTATVQDPIYASDGHVLIPSGATVRGRVVQVQKSDRVGETAMLNLAFEAVSFGEASYPLEASVLSASPERVSRQSGRETAGKAAAGAAAGAILGRVLGKDTKSTIKGAVIGAAAGTAIAMGTADVDAVLKAGSLMVIKVDVPIDVEYEKG